MEQAVAVFVDTFVTLATYAGALREASASETIALWALLVALNVLAFARER